MKKTTKYVLLLTLVPWICMMLSVPFLNSFAAKRADNTIQERMQAQASFLERNGNTFVNLSSEWILPSYIKYLEDVKQPVYETIYSNGNDVSKQEKQALQNLLNEDVNRFNEDFGSMYYYVHTKDKEVYTNNMQLAEYEENPPYPSDNIWFIVIHFDQDGILNVKRCSSSVSVEQFTTAFDNTKSDLHRRMADIDIKGEFVTMKDTVFIFEINSTMGIGDTSKAILEGADTLKEEYATKAYCFTFITSVLLTSLIAYSLKKKEEALLRLSNKHLPFEIIAIICGSAMLFVLSNASAYLKLYTLQSYLFFIKSCYFSVFLLLSYYGAIWFADFVMDWQHTTFKDALQTSSFIYSNITLWKRLWQHMINDLIGFKEDIHTHWRCFMLVLCNLIVILLLRILPPIFYLFYGITMFIILVKIYDHKMRDFTNLQKVIKHFANGHYQVPFVENLGTYACLREDFLQMQQKINEIVEQELTSQRMKNELITNVSHDLKTPLTSMISYIDLLKNDQTDAETKEKYLTILERNADRLKHLIEDLFELSKASSGTLDLNMTNIDIISLLQQVELECEGLFEKKGLVMKHQLSTDKIYIQSDPQKAFRIFENLFGNIAKYAMANTRVYITVTDFDSRVDVELKNISKEEITFTPEEIMERFTRGDTSRNSEGSGLGLSIVKSFTELLHGSVQILLDGDVFKVLLSFYR